MKFKETIIFFTCGLVIFVCGAGAGYLNRDIKAMQDEAGICTPDHLCPNSLEAIKRLRSYQLDTFNDSTVVWDGDRKVGVLNYQYSSPLDSLISLDNQ